MQGPGPVAEVPGYMPPVEGYWSANLDFPNRGKAWKSGFKTAHDEFQYAFKAAIEAIVRYEPDNAKRLAGYRAKDAVEPTEHLWAERLAKFPDYWQKEQDDYAHLRELEAEGKL